MENRGAKDATREHVAETRDVHLSEPPREEVRCERAPRAVNKESQRRVRPSALQKLVKRYDGSGDPHDHVAAYKQAVHAEQVRDTHTQIEGFGLTLEIKALTWFQTLGPESKVSLD